MNCDARPILRLEAYTTTEFEGGPIGAPQSFRLTIHVPTLEDARNLAARFPKSCGMRTATHTSYCEAEGERLPGRSPLVTTVSGTVSAYAKLRADGANGGRNEAGIRRYHAIIRAAAKLGIAVEYRALAGNAYPSRDAFEAAIA